MESMVTLFNTSFRDCDIFCIDGVISINKMFLGLIFPFLGDVIGCHGIGDVTILLPNERTEFIENKIIHFLDMTEKTHEVDEYKYAEEVMEKEEDERYDVGINNTIGYEKRSKSIVLSKQNSGEPSFTEANKIKEKNGDNSDSECFSPPSAVESENKTYLGNFIADINEIILNDSPMMTKSLQIGTSFNSKEEVKEHVQLFSEANFSPLVLKRSYLTKKNTHRITYVCPYGINRKSKSTGQRQVRQKYVACPVMININQQSNRSYLVRKAELGHKNHEVGEEMFARYRPKLSKDQEDIIKAFLETEPSETEICQVLHDLTGKIFKTKAVRWILKKLDLA